MIRLCPMALMADVVAEVFWIDVLSGADFLKIWLVRRWRLPAFGGGFASALTLDATDATRRYATRSAAVSGG